MQYLNKILSFVLFVATLPLALSGVTGIRDDAVTQYNNYPTELMTYNGSIAGIPWNAKGSIEEVYTQFFAAHPEVNSTEVISSLQTAASAKRNKSTFLCLPIAGWNWSGADPERIQDGISYLNGLGTCNAPATTCVRISCSWDSAIFLCNDNPYPIDPSCSYLATYAKDIKDGCLQWFKSGITWYETVGGQEFDTDRYNIVVRYDRC